jgi:lipopolysaccharide export system protein LptC
LSVELHLPDLPEVPISLGPAAGAPPRARTPWHLRLRDALSSYLPLLLMALLALATWWLVKNSPRPEAARPAAAVSSEPDYTMTQFAVERFDASGRLKLRIEGAQLRHFPDTDRIEIEGAQIRAYAPDGRVTLATAKRALGNGDGSEIQLLGGAEVTAQDGSGVPLVMKGEFLHAFLVTERVKTHLPVTVRQGGSEFRAAGLEYDHAARRLDLKGPLRAVLSPRPAPAPAASASLRAAGKP